MSQNDSRPQADTSSSCCSPTAITSRAEPASACCGDPTPNAHTGACCSDPADSCSCNSTVTVAPVKRARGESTQPSTRLPVAIIGAGPVGLAAAAHLIEKGETPIVLEAGDAVAASIREWAHVRLFSPWRYLVDAAARRLLEPTGWSMPNEDYLPTGGELIAQLLDPTRRASGHRSPHPARSTGGGRKSSWLR